MIRVLFFAQLREQLGCEQLALALTEPISISQLRQLLVEQHPQWGNFLGSDKLLFAINQTMAKASQLIRDGDEVAFFPPVTGG
jgi:sulfur-carrier protein